MYCKMQQLNVITNIFQTELNNQTPPIPEKMLNHQSLVHYILSKPVCCKPPEKTRLLATACFAFFNPTAQHSLALANASPPRLRPFVRGAEGNEDHQNREEDVDAQTPAERASDLRTPGLRRSEGPPRRLGKRSFWIYLGISRNIYRQKCFLGGA